MKVSEIKPNPNNPRVIKDDKFDKLVASLKEFPEMANVRPVVINQDNVILGGNMRFKAMKAAGWKDIPVTKVDWTEEQQRQFIIKDNVSGGEWDWDSLANEWDAEELEAWGLDLPESIADDAEVEEDEAPEVSSEPAVSELGAIYELGRHRLMCGDSTDFGAVSDLLDGQTIEFLFTDPPYGINEKGDRSKRGGLGKGGLAKARKYDDFIDDSTEYATKAYNIVEELNIKTQVWFGANYYCHHLPQTNNWLVWDKRVEEKQKDTQSDCELAWVKTGASSIRIFRHLWKGMMKDSERGQGRVHPTQKPVELVSWCFTQYKAGNNVLDLFGGSGSTLIACEQLDRTCYMMELDPKYVDVIRKRYAKFTAADNQLPENWEELTPRIN